VLGHAPVIGDSRHGTVATLAVEPNVLHAPAIVLTADCGWTSFSATAGTLLFVPRWATEVANSGL